MEYFLPYCKQQMSFISNFSHHRRWAGEPWGNSGRKEYLLSCSHQTADTPYGEAQGSSGCERHRMKVKVTQSCLTLCEPMDCSRPGFSVHGILQASIMEWVDIPFCRGSSPPRDWTCVFCIAGRFFTIWATRESQIAAVHIKGVKSFALSAWMSLQTIHFLVLEKSPLSGPGRGPPSCNRFHLEAPRKNLFPVLFQFLENTCIPWLMATSPKSAA